MVLIGGVSAVRFSAWVCLLVFVAACGERVPEPGTHDARTVPQDPGPDAGRHPAFPDTWVYRARPSYGLGGAVASADPGASAAGVDVLNAGGNAVDAAVATALCLAVTYPVAGNLGGGGFLVLRTADGEVAALDFRETAPAAATRDMYLDASGELTDASLFGPRAAGVPGSVAGLYAAHERYGRLPWADVVAPAIRLAESGFVANGFLERDLANTWKQLDARAQERRDASGAAAGLAAEGGDAEAGLAEDGPDDAAAFVAMRRRFGGVTRGTLVQQPELAATLRRLAEHGPDDFYRGETAAHIVATMEAHGGLIDADDLDGYRAVWREPLRFAYRDHEVISMPPVSSGGATMAQMANILSAYDFSELGFGSALRIHLFAEAARRAYADRNAVLGDPDFVDVPLARLVSRPYADVRRADIDVERATASSAVGPGGPPVDGEGNTTHLSVVDADGAAVSLTTTLNTGFGCKTEVEGAGFLLNNEMDDFAARPGHPNTYGLVQGAVNAIAPGKRMLSSMSPSIVLDPDGDLFLVTGTPGGSRIINVTFQSISNAVDFGMDVAQLVSAPRVHHQHLPDLLWWEEGGLSPVVLQALEARGHELRARDVFCDVHAIMVRPDGTIEAASDPRGPGAAVAQ